MSKVYVLQIDLQKAKSGEKFYYKEGYFSYVNRYNPNYITLPEEVVENCSIFKPEKGKQEEQPTAPVSTDVFVWTDELVRSFQSYYVDNPHMIWEHCVDKFKSLYKSKSTLKEQPKEDTKIEVVHSEWNAPPIPFKENTFEHLLLTNNPIPPEKYDAIKKLIERFLNDEMTTPENLLRKIAEHELIFGRKYTEDELLKAQEDAFNESRKTHPLTGFKHDTFQDYIQSKNKQP